MATSNPIQPSSEGYKGSNTDLGPWVVTPSSTRVSRYRYDYENRAIQVQWRNNKNHGYIYRGADYETYRSFARAVSKGRSVNNLLDNLDYGLMTPDEVDAASTRTTTITSRVRS